jgi:hypothetical protein
MHVSILTRSYPAARRSAGREQRAFSRPASGRDHGREVEERRCGGAVGFHAIPDPRADRGVAASTIVMPEALAMAAVFEEFHPPAVMAGLAQAIHENTALSG